ANPSIVPAKRRKSAFPGRRDWRGQAYSYIIHQSGRNTHFLLSPTMMHLPFEYEQELCDVLGAFLPGLIASGTANQSQATYVRRAVGPVIPDFLSISSPSG